MTKHATNQLCPICLETQLQHVHCQHGDCPYVVTTCPSCDKEQAVRAFMADHEKDCEHQQTVPFERPSAPTLLVRRVA